MPTRSDHTVISPPPAGPAAATMSNSSREKTLSVGPGLVNSSDEEDTDLRSFLPNISSHGSPNSQPIQSSSYHNVSSSATVMGSLARSSGTTHFVRLHRLSGASTMDLPPSLFELVMEPLFMPFELNIERLFSSRNGGWNPMFDAFRIHTNTWHPGSMSDRELFIRHYDPYGKVAVMMTVEGMEIRVVSNLASECHDFFRGM